MKGDEVNREQRNESRGRWVMVEGNERRITKIWGHYQTETSCTIVVFVNTYLQGCGGINAYNFGILGRKSKVLNFEKDIRGKCLGFNWDEYMYV